MVEEAAIRCTINGLEYELPEGTTLMRFLKMKDVPHEAVVVECNKKIVLKGTYETVTLTDGDTLEIVRIIGGG